MLWELSQKMFVWVWTVVAPTTGSPLKSLCLWRLSCKVDEIVYWIAPGGSGFEELQQRGRHLVVDVVPNGLHLLLGQGDLGRLGQPGALTIRLRDASAFKPRSARKVESARGLAAAGASRAQAQRASRGSRRVAHAKRTLFRSCVARLGSHCMDRALLDRLGHRTVTRARRGRVAGSRHCHWWRACPDTPAPSASAPAVACRRHGPRPSRRPAPPAPAEPSVRG
eukprot:gene779-biopygen18174